MRFCIKVLKYRLIKYLQRKLVLICSFSQLHCPICGIFVAFRLWILVYTLLNLGREVGSVNTSADVLVENYLQIFVGTSTRTGIKTGLNTYLNQPAGTCRSLEGWSSSKIYINLYNNQSQVVQFNSKKNGCDWICYITTDYTAITPEFNGALRWCNSVKFIFWNLSELRNRKSLDCLKLTHWMKIYKKSFS